MKKPESQTNMNHQWNEASFEHKANQRLSYYRWIYPPDILYSFDSLMNLLSSVKREEKKSERRKVVGGWGHIDRIEDQ